MVGFSTYAALLPELRDLWRLSNAEAGVVGGMFFAGYIATVSFWTALTDRVDGRKVYLAGGLLTAAGSAGFGLLAGGFASAVLFQCLLGAGIAATYMPGLRLLSDRISGPGQSRTIAFYTSFFGIGTALSLLIAGGLAPLSGWQWAFIASGTGPLLAVALVMWGIAPLPPKTERKGLALGDLFPLAAWRRVLASRPAAMIAAVVNLLAVPASILGNEMALRIGRRPWILLAMAGSGVAGMLVGLSAPWHWAIVLALVTVYSMLVMADSATLTAGLVAAAPAELRGAAMGLYSLIGFGGGLLGPVIFGVALDAAGGAGAPIAWVAGYAAIGAGCLLAPLVGRMNRRTL